MLFPALLIFGPRHSPLAQVRRKPAPVTNLGSGSKQLPPVLPVTAKNALHEVSCVIGGEGTSFLGVESEALQALAPSAIHLAMQQGHLARALADPDGRDPSACQDRQGIIDIRTEPGNRSQHATATL